MSSPERHFTPDAKPYSFPPEEEPSQAPSNSALGQEIQKSICIFVLVYSCAVDTPASLVIQS